MFGPGAALGNDGTTATSWYTIENWKRRIKLRLTGAAYGS